MNDPCENKSYRAKLSLSLKIGGLNFLSETFQEFETNLIGGTTDNYLDNLAIKLFREDNRDSFDDFNLYIEVLSLKRF